MKTLYSTPDAKHYGMHDIPDDWIIESNKLCQYFKDHISDSVLCFATPATKGGWRKGYSWRGNFRVTIQFKNNRKYGPKIKFTKYIRGNKIVNYGDNDTFTYKVEDLRSFWDKIKGKINLAECGERILTIYRDSGLIPQGVSKRHSKKVRENFNREDRKYYQNPDLIEFVGKMMSRYIRRYSQCPKCDARGFQETILGYVCNKCQCSYIDIAHPHHWENT
jgi:hypothetical protein